MAENGLGSRRGRTVLAGLSIAAVLGTAAFFGAQAVGQDPSPPAKALPATTVDGFAPAGSLPYGVAVNPATNTIYVADADQSVAGLSVIAAATCSAAVLSGCPSAPVTAVAGSGAQAVAVDTATNTVYVANANDNTVSVINGSACDAANTSGCGTTPPAVPVGTDPSDLAIDGATNTVYVTNTGDGTVSVINGATCDAANTSGCGATPPTVTVGNAPAGVAVNSSTDSIYVANQADDTMSVINGASCEGTNTSGCGATPATVSVGASPQAVAVNRATDTAYVANLSDNTVSVVNGGSCNGTTTSGCGATPPTVTVGNAPYGLAIDTTTDIVYVANSADDTVSVVNGANCNATTVASCVSSETVPVGQAPYGVAIGSSSTPHSVYVANDTDNTLSVLGSTAASPYRLAGKDGGVYTFGGASYLGSLPALSIHPAAPVVGLANDPAGNGYWLVGADGGVYAFGAAQYFGSMGGQHLNAPVVGMAVDPAGTGYWLVGADGGVYAFGTAPYAGSMGGQPLNAPVVGITPGPYGTGYWLVGADGGVYAFGSAPYAGSMGGQHLNAPVVGIAGGPGLAGYWLVGSDGGVYAFGSAPYLGSMGGQHLNAPIVSLATDPNGAGYWLFAADGGVFDFGGAPFSGSLPSIHVAPSAAVVAGRGGS